MAVFSIILAVGYIILMIYLAYCVITLKNNSDENLIKMSKLTAETEEMKKLLGRLVEIQEVTQRGEQQEETPKETSSTDKMWKDFYGVDRYRDPKPEDGPVNGMIGHMQKED